MPHVQANNIEIYYEVQGEGEPLVLIPYLAADQACYAFQVADYAKQFTCYTRRPARRGTVRASRTASTPPSCSPTTSRRSCRPSASRSAHVSGLSLGAAAGMWLAAKYPSLVKSLSLHSALDRDGPVPAGRRGGLADHGEGARQRHRHGHPGHLPLVLHPGALRGQAGVHRLARRLRAQPADAAGGRVPAPVGARCSRTTRPACSA